MTAKEAPPLVSGSKPQTLLGRIAGVVSVGGLGGVAWIFKDAIEPAVKALGDGVAHAAAADPIVTTVVATAAAVAGAAGYIRYRLDLHSRDVLRQRAADEAVRYKVLTALLGEGEAAYFTATDFEDELARQTTTASEIWDETTLRDSSEAALKALVEQKSIDPPRPMRRGEAVALYYTFKKPESVPPSSTSDTELVASADRPK